MLRVAGATFIFCIVTMTAALAQEPSHWVLRSPTEGAPPCRAVMLGSEVNVQLVRTRDDRLGVIVGNAPPDQSGSSVQLTLAVDAAEPVTLTGYPVGPVVIVRIDDAVLEQRLRDADTLAWRFPWGTYSARVTGLGAAFDAIGVCPG